jgi:hypothetical protein
MRLTNKASLRQLVRGAKTIRGALVLLFLIAGLGLWLAIMVGMMFLKRDAPEALSQSGAVGPYLPLLLMALFLQSVLARKSGEMLLHFTPPEVEFLFSGPFHRRDLLIYKLRERGIGLVVVALMLSLTPLALFFRSWLSLFVGLTLSLAFLNLASLAVGLLRLITVESAHTRARKAVLIAVAVLVAVALPGTVSGARVLHTTDLAWSFRSTWPGRVLLAPFEVFSHAMLAERWLPDLIGWAGAAAAIDLGLLILVLKLDADYLEWSASTSQRVYEIQQRARRSGGFPVNPSRERSRFSLPQLPWLGGAGPIARTQLILTGRKCRGAIRVALIVSAAILIWNGFWSGRSALAAVSPGMVLGILSYITFLFGSGFPVAFRGDLNQMKILKSLPVGPLALVVGELAGCAAIMSGCQFGFLAIYGIIAPSGAWMLLAAAILAPSINWVLLATSNLLFLLFPVPTEAGAAANLNLAGRGCLTALLQMLVTVVLLGIPAGLAGLAYLASGFSRSAMVVAALVALAIEAVTMTVLVAWAFERFDPSMDTPA